MTIKLEDFVADSLVQIVRGVTRAQEELKDTGARVSPLMLKTQREASIGEARMAGGQPVYDVVFDVAVSGSESTSTSGGVGVVVGVFGLGSKGESADAQSNLSRIQFRVPLLLPRQGPEEST